MVLLDDGQSRYRVCVGLTLSVEVTSVTDSWVLGVGVVELVLEAWLEELEDMPGELEDTPSPGDEDSRVCEFLETTTPATTPATMPPTITSRTMTSMMTLVRVNDTPQRLQTARREGGFESATCREFRFLESVVTWVTIFSS